MSKKRARFRNPLVIRRYVAVDALRQAVADYMHSEGCGCCGDHDSHRIHLAALGKLLRVPKRKDYYNFAPYRSKP